MFLNEEMKPFKELSDENKLGIIKAKELGLVEIKHLIWSKADDAGLAFNGVYRIIPQKPSINWDEVSDDLNYLFINRFGTLVLSGVLPETHEGYLHVDFKYLCIHAQYFKSANKGSCSSKDSLVVRPGYKEE